jgi:hypothetical protein
MEGLKQTEVLLLLQHQTGSDVLTQQLNVQDDLSQLSSSELKKALL